MPKGGHRPGAGRKKGTTTQVALAKKRATKAELEDIGAMARPYAAMALETLRKIASGGESENAKVSAANALLDRAYGKAKQPIDGQLNGKFTVGWIA